MNIAGRWILLLELPESEKYLLECFRTLELKIAYFGKCRAIAEICDRVFWYDTINDLQLFLERELDEIRTLNPISVVGFMENTKQTERRLLKELGISINNDRIYDVLRNKVTLRQTLEEVSIPTVKYVFLTDLTGDKVVPLEFPFVVKPNFGYSSGGVQLVKDQDSFRSALKIINRLNKMLFKSETNAQLGAICEEYIDGDEYSIDSITVDGLTRAFLVCKRKFPGEDNFSDYLYATPFVGHEEIRLEGQNLISRIADYIGLKNGPTHAEFRWCDKRNQLMLIDIGFRIGGAGNLGRLFHLTSGIDLNKLALRALVGDLGTKELFMIKPIFHRFGASISPDIGKGGRIMRINSIEYLERDPSIAHFFLNKKVGDFVVPYPRGVDCLGEIQVIENDEVSLNKSICRLFENFHVIYEPDKHPTGGDERYSP